MPYLTIFGLELKKKKLLSYLNQHPQICLFAKFHKKNQKCLNLGPKMPDLCIFGLEFENNIVIPALFMFEIGVL